MQPASEASWAAVQVLLAAQAQAAQPWKATWAVAQLQGRGAGAGSVGSDGRSRISACCKAPCEAPRSRQHPSADATICQSNRAPRLQRHPKRGVEAAHGGGQHAAQRGVRRQQHCGARVSKGGSGSGMQGVHARLQQPGCSLWQARGTVPAARGPAARPPTHPGRQMRAPQPPARPPRRRWPTAPRHTAQARWWARSGRRRRTRRWAARRRPACRRR